MVSYCLCEPAVAELELLQAPGFHASDEFAVNPDEDDYDPRSPEFIIKVSEEEAARLDAERVRGQIRCLESNLRQRQRRSDIDEPLEAHYEGFLADLRSKLPSHEALPIAAGARSSRIALGEDMAKASPGAPRLPEPPSEDLERPCVRPSAASHRMAGRAVGFPAGPSVAKPAAWVRTDDGRPGTTLEEEWACLARGLGHCLIRTVAGMMSLDIDPSAAEAFLSKSAAACHLDRTCGSLDEEGSMVFGPL